MDTPTGSRGLQLPQFHPIQLKLDRSNYAFWRALVQSAIRAHAFDDLISSTAVSPSPLLPTGPGGDVVPNPEFVNWIRRDQYLLSWMLSSVGETMLGHVVRCETAREIWKTLETVFHTQSKSQVAQYRVQLQSTRKGALSVEDYFMKMRGIADQLAAIGKPLDDDELLMHIMAGFGPEYESLVVNTMQRTDSPNLQEIQLAFQAYEVRLAQQHAVLFDHSANVVYRRGQSGGYGGTRPPISGMQSGGQSGRGGPIVSSGRGGNRPNFSKMLICQLCGRSGHVALKCFKRFDIHFTGNDSTPTAGPQVFLSDFSGNVDVYSGNYGDGEGNWYVDSGATTHITHDPATLAMSTDYIGHNQLTVGNGNTVPISGIGSNSLLVPSSSSSSLLLNNILFVPQITKNLLSISQFTKDNNVVIEFNSDACFVKDKLSNKILLRGSLSNGLYKLDLTHLLSKSKFKPSSVPNKSCPSNHDLNICFTETQPICSRNKYHSCSYCTDVVSKDNTSFPCNTGDMFNCKPCAMSCTTADFSSKLGNMTESASMHFAGLCKLDADTIHQMCGHPNPSILSKICAQMNIPFSSKLLTFCEACNIGKLHQKQHISSPTKTTRCFELIHSDLWGPSHVASRSGFKYYISFVDDFSRYTWIYPLTLKSDALATIKNFLAKVQTQFQTSVASFQSDWGGEFRPLEPYLASLGTHFQHPCPYIHTQNGKVERKHQHVVDVGLTLLAQASMPLTFWWDAFHTAVFLINRLPSPSLNMNTPYTILHTKTPDYTLLQPFGCTCFPYLRPYSKTKLQFRSSKCVFLGYSDFHKGYKCLHPNGKVYISDTVKFNPKEFPYTQLFSTNSSAPSASASSCFPTPAFLSSLVPPPGFPGPSAHDSALSHNSSSPTTTSSATSSSSPSPSPSNILTNSASPTLSPAGLSSSPSSSPPSSSPSLPPQNTHTMITRSKNGIFKPKVFSVTTLPSEPKNYASALLDPDWYNAMKVEYQALMDNKTWSLVPYDPSMKVISNKWVYRVKTFADGSLDKLKARLVARGFEQFAGVDFLETFSPVVKSSTIRLVFTLAATRKWSVQQIDVTNAFLNGDLEDTIFMSQPHGFVDPDYPAHVCKLHKSLYGLKQAPRAWYIKLKTCLLEMGFKRSTSDFSLFHKSENGQLLLILVYVDDILITGDSKDQVHQVIKLLQENFKLKTFGEVTYFLGIEVERSESGFMLSQKKYIHELLQKTSMQDCTASPTPMVVSPKLSKKGGKIFDDPSLFRSVVGTLQYLTLTRPDIAYSVNKLSQFLTSPSKLHWDACKRLLKYLKGTSSLSLHFTGSSASELYVEGFADADYAGCTDDMRSTGGHCVFLGGNLVIWSARKQEVVSRSSTESEYRSLANLTCDVMWLKSVCKELDVQLCASPPRLWCDNSGAIALAQNPVFHARTKHIEVDIHFVREKVLAKIVEVGYVPSSDQIANVFTKPLSEARFIKLRDKLKMIDTATDSMEADDKG